MIANLNILEVKLSMKKTGRKKKAAERQSTMLASNVNELPQIEHPHVLLGLAVAIDAVHEELYARSQTSSEEARGAMRPDPHDDSATSKLRAEGEQA